MEFINIVSKIDKPNWYICKCIECGNTYETYLDKRSGLQSAYCTECSTLPDDITQESLKKFYIYNPITGEFIRRLPTKSTNIGENPTFVNSQGYLVISWNGTHQLAHRLAWLYIYGSFPAGQIDHIDHNKLNNSITNLRAVESRENQLNCSLSKNSTTKVNGVSYHKNTGKYRAYIMVNRKQVHLGLFDSLEEAKQAREQADIKYNFHTNHGK